MLLIVVSASGCVVTDLVLGLVAVAVFPLLMVLNVVYQKRVDRHYDAAQQALGDFSGAVHESFEGVQLVKAYGAEHRETERLSAMAGKIRDSRIRAVYLRGTFEALLEVIPSITNIGIVVLGAIRVDSGDLTIGELSGFIYMFTLLVFPLRLIGYALSELPHSSAGYRRVQGTIDEPLDADPEQSIVPAAAPAAVVLDDVSYTFADAAEADDRARQRHASRPARVTAFVGRHRLGQDDAGRADRRAGAPDRGPRGADAGRAGDRVPGGVPVRRHGARQRVRSGSTSTTSRSGRRCGMAAADDFVQRPARTGSTRSSASAASRCRAGNASASRSARALARDPTPAAARRHDLGARPGDRDDGARQPARRRSADRPW